MGKLIMVRHGESEGNRDRRFTISPEVPITDLGRQQAREAAAVIARHFNPRLIISSPFRRARQTSEIIGEILQLPIEVVHDLHERDLGRLKGESYDALRELVRQDPVYNPKQGWLWRPEGGESYEEVRQRVVAAVEGVLARYPNDELVIVSHGGVMLSMWAHVIGRWEGAHLPPNCGIVMIEHDAAGYHAPVPIEG
jgi:broad specificity phosphatase PhoE